MHQPPEPPMVPTPMDQYLSTHLWLTCSLVEWCHCVHVHRIGKMTKLKCFTSIIICTTSCMHTSILSYHFSTAYIPRQQMKVISLWSHFDSMPCVVPSLYSKKILMIDFKKIAPLHDNAPINVMPHLPQVGPGRGFCSGLDIRTCPQGWGFVPCLLVLCLSFLHTWAFLYKDPYWSPIYNRGFLILKLPLG